jgi:hypothetical protein
MIIRGSLCSTDYGVCPWGSNSLGMERDMDRKGGVCGLGCFGESLGRCRAGGGGGCFLYLFVLCLLGLGFGYGIGYGGEVQDTFGFPVGLSFSNAGTEPDARSFAADCSDG